MRFKNSQGQIFYAMHMMPGIVSYYNHAGTEGESRYFLSENTIRKMDPTFAGRPVYVDHVDEVNEDIDALRAEADGWVVESFYNKADGKHWAKMVITSKAGIDAIAQGYRPSNCYNASKFANGGTWNATEYKKEVTDAVYDHLALVTSPRYEESVVMTPEEFKAYNQKHEENLEKLSNSKGKKMKFQFFKKEKVTNSKDADIESLSVLLPKSGREITIEKMVNEMDAVEVAKSTSPELDMGARVKVGDSEMSITELVAAYLSLSESIVDAADEVDEEVEDDMEEDFENESDDEEDFENESDEEVKPPKKKDPPTKVEKTKNSLTKAELLAKKAKAAKEKAKALRMANSQGFSGQLPEAKVVIAADQLARGKANYGR